MNRKEALLSAVPQQLPERTATSVLQRAAIVTEAEDVVYGKVFQEVKSAVICGCGACSNHARGYIDVLAGEAATSTAVNGIFSLARERVFREKQTRRLNRMIGQEQE